MRSQHGDFPPQPPTTMSGHFQSWDSSEDDSVETLLADESQKNLKVFCALCSQIYQDPHITSCGHTFCRRCVSSNSEAVCPLDSTKLSLLVKNLAVAEEVGELLIYCRYGCRVVESRVTFEVDPNGCPAKIKLGKRADHEKECGYAPVFCPNSPVCGKMLRSELQHHKKTCQYQRCPHYKYNCRFQGTPEEIETHLNTCKYEGVKGFLRQVEGVVKLLRGELEKRDETIHTLSSSLGTLSSRLEEVEKSSSLESGRVEYLEKQQSELSSELSHAKSSLSIMMRELKVFRQQMGVPGLMDQQHLYKCQGTFVGHKGPVWALAKHNDILFSASADCTIKVWDLSATYAGPMTLTGHADIVLTLCVHNDTLFSGSNDMTIKVWNVDNLKVDVSFHAHEDPVCTLTSSDTFLFSGSLKSIKVWDRTSYSLVKTLPTQNHWVRTLEVYGKYLYSGSYQAVKVWNLESLEVAHVLKSKGASVYCLAITDKDIICGTYENTIQVWDVRTLQEKGTLTGHTGAVYAVAVLRTPGRERLFSASYDKTIRVWNLELMMCAQTLTRHEGSVTCLLTSGGRIFSGAIDNMIKLWQ